MAMKSLGDARRVPTRSVATHPWHVQHSRNRGIMGPIAWYKPVLSKPPHIIALWFRGVWFGPPSKAQKPPPKKKAPIKGAVNVSCQDVDRTDEPARVYIYILYNIYIYTVYIYYSRIIRGPASRINVSTVISGGNWDAAVSEYHWMRCSSWGCNAWILLPSFCSLVSKSLVILENKRVFHYILFHRNLLKVRK